MWCSSTEETKLLYLSSLVCYAQVVGGECWSCFWQGGLLSSKKQFAFGKGEKAKVLSGCGVLAVIWVIWMERNRTFKFIVVQRWKSFRRELSSGHIYIGLCFVGNLKITLFLLFCFKWDSSCSLGVFFIRLVWTQLSISGWPTKELQQNWNFYSSWNVRIMSMSWLTSILSVQSQRYPITS